MTKERRLSRFTAIALIVLMLLAGIIFESQAQNVLMLGPGQYAEQGDIIIYYTPLPITKNEKITFGQQGDTQKAEDVLEDVGVASNVQFHAIKNESGWPALRTIVYQFDRITIEKYKWTNYDKIRPKLLEVFDLISNAAPKREVK